MEKDEAKVRAGRSGASKRWKGHPSKTVSLAGLPSEQRAFIADLIETARRNAQRSPDAA